MCLGRLDGDAGHALSAGRRYATPVGDMAVLSDTLVGAEPLRDDATARFAKRIPVARLVMLAGNEVGRVFPLARASTTIGRQPDSAIQILGDDVSRQHARVVRDGPAYVLEDLGSRNGTLVNGVRVRRHALAVGDRVQLGSSAILVFTQPDDLEQRAQKLQRLEAMSSFAAAMAHDLRNLLGIVDGHADLIVRYTSQVKVDARVGDSVRDLREAASRAMELTGRLIEFARGDASDTGSTAVDVREVVAGVFNLVRVRAPGNVRFTIEVPAGTTVRATPAALHQILLNLSINAMDAMPRGGKLRVKASTAELERGAALQLNLPSQGMYAEISVGDTGVGMDAATLDRIFEPYFTTKPVGRGTGLGLASVFGLVRRFGGAVFAESTPGHGSTFRFLLPTPTVAPEEVSPVTAYDTR